MNGGPQARLLHHDDYANAQSENELHQTSRDSQGDAQDRTGSSDAILGPQDARATNQAQRPQRRKSIQSPCTCVLAEEDQWLVAEQGYPDGRAPVVSFDDHDFQVKSAGDLKGCRAIASKLPSRWPGTVYVYTQSALSASSPLANHHRVRVSGKKGAPEGLRWSKTLHLSKLPLLTKIRILSGRIKWLFVVPEDAQRAT